MSTKTNPLGHGKPLINCTVYVEFTSGGEKEILEAAGFTPDKKDVEQDNFIRQVEAIFLDAARACFQTEMTPMPANVIAELDKISPLAEDLSKSLTPPFMSSVVGTLIAAVLLGKDIQPEDESTAAEALNNLRETLNRIATAAQKNSAWLKAERYDSSGGARKRMKAMRKIERTGNTQASLLTLFMHGAPYFCDSELQKEMGLERHEMKTYMQEFLNICFEVAQMKVHQEPLDT